MSSGQGDGGRGREVAEGLVGKEMRWLLWVLWEAGIQEAGGEIEEFC